MINAGDLAVIVFIGILFIGSIVLLAPTLFRDQSDD